MRSSLFSHSLNLSPNNFFLWRGFIVLLIDPFMRHGIFLIYSSKCSKPVPIEFHNNLLTFNSNDAMNSTIQIKWTELFVPQKWQQRIVGESNEMNYCMFEFQNLSVHSIPYYVFKAVEAFEANYLVLYIQKPLFQLLTLYRKIFGMFIATIRMFLEYNRNIFF